MTSVSMFDAKTNLSRYVSTVEAGIEPFIVIVRNGTPVAKLVPYEDRTHRRIGIAKGVLPMMGSLDDFNSISSEADFLGDGGLL